MRVMNLVAVRTPGRWSLALLLALVAATPSVAATRVAAAKQTSAGVVARAVASLTGPEAMHPIERQLRDQFPAVALDSQASLEAAQEFVAGQMVSGMRAHQPQPALRVFYPGSYDETFVAELGDQRVALRAVGARFAQAAAAGGKVFYASPHQSVDVIEVPGMGRSEELLVLHDARAPRVFEYEIVEMSGVAGLSLHDGAIRFLPDRVAMPTVAEIAGGRFTTPQPSLQIDRPWVIDANGKRSESAARWTVVEEEGQPRRIRLTISSDALAYPLVVDPSFSATGQMGALRYSHTATLLPNGKVLIAGGNNGSANVNTAELYDPASGAFTTAGTMTEMRSGHTATLLANGKVLIAGGTDAGAVNTAELYDPASGTPFTGTGPMTAARRYHTATLLPNGQVLIAGGITGLALVNTNELYASGTFTPDGNLAAARENHTATLLPSGKVLIAGGDDGNAPLNTTELYDNGTSTAIGNMTAARFRHTATLLPNGKVFIMGGASTLFGASLGTGELYNPADNGFTATVATTARQNHTATLLPNGKVLIAGGAGNGLNSSPLNTAQVYEPSDGSFMFTTNNMAGARWNHTATLLPSGIVLIAGGQNPAALNTAERYDSATGTFTSSGFSHPLRQDHSATLLPNGKVLLAGGLTVARAVFDEAWLYDSAGGTYTATGTMTAPRNLHTATLLTNGKVLITGGENNISGMVASAELYDPATGIFTATGSMTETRGGHTATLLPNGRVLIAGGHNGSNHLNTAELYDPASSMFTAAGNMSGVRSLHTATLLPNGKVLVAGSVNVSSVDLYDPATGTFAATGTMATPRFRHVATLLKNGKVLIAAGQATAGQTLVTTAELYDPASGTFAATGSPNTTHGFEAQATLLPTGQVLVTGGFNGSIMNAAELYDPSSGTFSATANMIVARYAHTSTLLTNGKVLIASGFAGFSDTILELYDAGLGYADSRRPVVVSAPATLAQPAAITLSGSGFRGDSEASGGSVNSSPTNYPLLQLQRVDNDQIVFVNASAWSDTGFTSTALSTLADGPYRVTIFTNGIPSVQRVILVTGFAPPAVPTFLSATATSSTTVAVSWAAVDGAATYEVYESEDLGVGYALILTTSATSFIHTGLQSDVTYLYKVRAIGHGGASGLSAVDAATTVMFTDASLGGMLIRLVHLVEIRRAIAAMRVAASLSPMSFTDPMPAPGTATIKAVHITELRLGLNQARAVIGLPPLVYADPTITPGSTVVKAAHFTELRAGTQ